MVCALALSGCAGPRFAPISADRFEQHVAFLADDTLAGRGTGTAGLDAAADYVAAEFEAAGLVPYGDGGDWFQRFDAAGNRRLIEGNVLVIAGHELTVGQDWMPFSSVPACELSGPLVFAGYGFSAEDGHDDYADLDVKGKVVLVIAGGPGQQPNDFASQINTAYKNGAAGILIANDPVSSPRGSAQDVTLPYEREGSAGVTASLPAAQLTGQAVATVLAGSGFDLTAQQRLIDESGQTASVDLGQVVVTLHIASERAQLATKNVVGVLVGNDPELAHEWILVGAHMDHLGLGQSSSMGGADAVGQIHNGADDNASGTAGVIEIAHLLAKQTGLLRRTVVFATFGAEEMGLLGSIWLNEHPPWPTDGLVAMVNMDMIGRATDGRVAVGGLGSGDVFPELFEDLVGALDEWAEVVDGEDHSSASRLQLTTSPSVTSNSDHYTFFKSEVPVLSLFTGLHDDYHKPSDDVSLVDVERGALIATLAAEFVVSVSDLDQRPEYRDPDEGRPAQVATVKPPEGRSVVRGGVRFGSRPDYAYTADDGVRIDGVSGDSPAEGCGLMHGDVIVAIDGTAIRNIQDYMVLLYSHRPGDEMVLTVRRGPEQLQLTALLEAGGNARR